MYIIIAGCSKVGASLVNKLSEEGNDVVVIDRDKDNFSQLGSGSNCMDQRFGRNKFNWHLHTGFRSEENRICRTIPRYW